MTPPSRRNPTRQSATRAASKAPPVLIDTGILVALFDRLDAHHDAAVAWADRSNSVLHTVVPVLTEASFFLPARLREALARLVANGALELHHPDAAGYARIAQLFAKYADQNPDWADMELVWLAESTGVTRIATLDVADYARIAQLFAKYADQNPDWADMELVWLAESTGVTRIATLDVADFSVYRIHGRKRFELELLR